MKYHPIQLGVQRHDWSNTNMPLISNDVEADKEKIFKRDDYTCQFCGFRAEKYQQIFHKNFYTSDYSDKNCLTACIFCHQCFDLKSVGSMSSGVLIWLPEIGQAALHHIMRALYIARTNQGPIKDVATSALKTLRDRREEARKRLGSEDPEALAIVMEDFLSEKKYKRVQNRIKGIRLMPLDRRIVKDGKIEKFNSFDPIKTYWRTKQPFKELPVKTWGEIFKNVVAL